MMKNTKILFVHLLFLILFFPSIFLAQAPESMNYQAVIRNGSGDLVTSQQVGLRIKILQGSATGSSVYEETYSPTTNTYGLVNLQLGTGTVQSGTFSSIDWGNGPYFVETAADVSGGTSYVTLSTTQFMSVPYALYAKSSDSWHSNANTTFSDKKVSVGHINELYPLSVQSFHDGTISRGIDVLRTDNSGANMGVPMSFSLLNSNNQPFEFGKVVGRTQSNTSGAEVGSLSLQVADGTPWGQNYEQERMRIDNDMVTINAENTANSVATLRLRGTNSNADHSQLVDMKSAVDGHVTSSKFTIATRNQGTMNDHFVIDSEGKVGIGTTSSPNKKLSIEHDDGFSSGEHILSNISRTTPTSGVAGLYFGYYADGTVETGGIVRSMGGLPLYLGTFSNKQLLTVGYNGNVGIGTTTPTSPLHVYGAQNTTLFTLSTSSSAQPYSNFTSRSITFKDTINNSNIGFRYEPPSSSLSINGEPTIGFVTDVSEGPARHFNIRFNGKNLFTVSGNGMTKVNSYLNLTPVSTPPSTPSKGDIYMDDSDNKLKYYNGTSWEDVSGSSSSNSNFPAGMIMPFAGSSIPAGWLLCDGSSVSKTTYSDLYSALGNAWGSASSTTFNIPDLRGRFLRGVDSGSGNDPDASSRTAINFGGNTGDNIGSYQNDEFKSHNHSYQSSTSSGGNGARFIYGASPSSSAYSSNEGGSETRPKNAYVNYIIKY